MRSALTRCLRIEERTLSIGFGIKRAAKREERRPEFTALPHPLRGRHGVPLRPLGTDEILGANVHRDCLALTCHVAGYKKRRAEKTPPASKCRGFTARRRSPPG